VGDAQILERLDQLLAVSMLAHHEAIESATVRIRADALSAAILNACVEDWTPVAQLRAAVRKQMDAHARTIQRRCRELVGRSVLTERGSTKDKAYRSPGVI
jgi:hypothetical protein